MMKGSMSTDLGIITINPEVIAKYAGSMAIECFGIVGMAAVNMKDDVTNVGIMSRMDFVICTQRCSICFFSK